MSRDDQLIWFQMADLTPEGYKTGVFLASDAILFTDGNGGVTFANPATVELLGADRQIYGEQLWTLFETSVEPSRELVERVLYSRSPTVDHRFVATVHRPDGERRAVLVRLQKMSSDSQPAALAAAFQDVTDSFRARQAMARAEHAQKLEAIGQLVSGIAHELNNPLSAVIAYCQLILSNQSIPPEEIQSLETILSEGRRAAKIVSNVLTFARQHRSQRALADINRVVDDTLALRRYALSGANIGLTIEIQQSIPSVWMDHFQIQQVLLNLINNAEHALKNWTGPRKIKIMTASSDEYVTVIVADTGPGIQEEIVQEIFNPFFTTKDVGQGTGLGLAISDGIVRAHGGMITVESTPGEGAAFTVRLPLPDEQSDETEQLSTP